MAALGYRSLPAGQIDSMVRRLSRPTKASESWNYKYDCEVVNANHLRARDPKFHQSKTVKQKQLDEIVTRLGRNTRASNASHHRFDHQYANLMHLYEKDPRMATRTPNSTSRVSSSASYRSRSDIMRSTGSSPIESEDSVSLLGLRRQQSRSSTTQGSYTQSARSRASTSGQSVTSEELQCIVGRLVKPTVASRGGVDYADRKWEYIPTPKLKTLPVVPGLETRFVCKNRKMSSEEFDGMVTRLTKPTRSHEARSVYTPNPHAR